MRLKFFERQSCDPAGSSTRSNHAVINFARLYPVKRDVGGGLKTKL